LNVTVTDQPQCKKQLRLEIPGELVRAETNKVATNLAKQVVVPGFRRGHVPTSVVKTRFKKELRDEVLSQLIPHSLGDVFKEKELKVVGQPSVDEMKFRDDETIDLVVTVEVAPEFELSNYKGLQVVKRAYRVNEKDIDRTIDRMREGYAQMVPVEDRGARNGDFVSANLTRRVLTDDQEEGDADSSDKAKTESQEIEMEVGGRGVLAEFTNALTDARAGETKKFTVEYPAEYKPESLANRTVEYTAEVTAVRAKELPDADDEFARTVGEEFEGIEALRKKVGESLEHEAEHRTEQEFKTAVIDQLVDRNRFEVPAVAVEEQIDSRTRTLLRQLSSQGMDPRHLNLNLESIREAQRERAEREVRAAFILDRIADAEKTEVSEEEMDQEVEKFAQGVGQSVEAVRARLTKEDSLDRLKEQVRNRKAIESVISSADIRIEEVQGLGGEESAGSSETSPDVRE
jgi:trigger factor